MAMCNVPADYLEQFTLLFPNRLSIHPHTVGVGREAITAAAAFAPEVFTFPVHNILHRCSARKDVLISVQSPLRHTPVSL